ncbi:hypothetical protein [Vibrio parahaemolyticus]|uniref:hypothetical protein n=1 Tax=Vibrio parahaemolyticus TaxID=670 RepID=UPI00226AE200|nr:hypothetical protein [Vibrio parahaemolyticus]MCX8795901.1 hypothetical protein [Vibrio parahaemolyticus]
MRKFFTAWEVLVIALTIISVFTHHEFIKKDVEVSYYTLPIYFDGRYQASCEMERKSFCYRGYPKDLISISIQNFSNEDLELLQFSIFGIFDLEEVFFKSTSDKINNQYKLSDVVSYNQETGVAYLRINDLDKNSYTVIELYGKILNNRIAFGLKDSTNNRRVEYRRLILLEDENMFSSRSIRIFMMLMLLIIIIKLLRFKVRVQN